MIKHYPLAMAQGHYSSVEVLSSMKICKNCGQQMTGTRNGRLYCSEKCQKNAEGKRATLRKARYADYQCPICGKSGQRRVSNGNRVVTCGARTCVDANKKSVRLAINKRYKAEGKMWPGSFDLCACGKQKRKHLRVCLWCRDEDRRIRALKKSSSPLNKCPCCDKWNRGKREMWGCSRQCIDELDRRRHYAKAKIRLLDPSWRLRMSFSSRVCSALRQRGRYKGFKTFALLGYTRHDLVAHLSSLMEFGMTWQNYGKLWHVDHIKPASWFKLKTDDDVRRCWALSNLQPRWATTDIAKMYGGFSEGNQNKGARYEG